MQNNYNHIARTYDLMSRMVFFKAQINVQIRQLVFIPPGASLLIVGGGTGWILEEIARLRPEGLLITYVEVAEKMLNRAKKRDVGNNKVRFIRRAIENMNPYDEVYDVVITAFLFDNFQQEKASLVFNLLHRQLKQDGLWFFSDFYLHPTQPTYWKKKMLGLMYVFFRWICQVEADGLVYMPTLFQQYGYQEIDQSWHYFKFIHGVVYKR